MKRGRSVLMTASVLACAVPAAGAVKVTPGQEFVYTGRVMWKKIVTGRPSEVLQGQVKLTALVTKADPAKGYSVIVTRAVQPEAGKGQPRAAGYADLTMAEWHANLWHASAWPGHLTDDTLGKLVQELEVPFAPQADLKIGNDWLTTDIHWALLSSGYLTLYHLAGETAAGGRHCLKIEKMLPRQAPPGIELAARFRQEPLPRREFSPGYYETLTDYGETICIDPATATVVSQRLHARNRQVMGKEQWTLESSAAVALREIRQLSPVELASRLRQAATIHDAEETLHRIQNHRAPQEARLWGSSEDLKALDETWRSLADFPRRFPDSPYASAVGPVLQGLGRTRGDAEKEARLQALKGQLAPDFKLKNLDGKAQSLGAYRGKLILLNFFASW